MLLMIASAASNYGMRRINFSKAGDLAGIEWGEGTPAIFHEQRLLSERLYKVQG